MKKRMILGAIFCSAFILSCATGGKFETKVMAAEVTSETDSQYEQLDMPIVAIDTENDAEITSGDEYVNAEINVIGDDGTYDMSDMAVSVRLRGNSSLGAAKPSYKLKFDKKQNVLSVGDGKGKTWGLIANYYDTSLLRNYTMYNLGDMLDGMSYSPNCKSVEVYVNGEYQGVYLLTELVNVNSNRVDITEEPDEVENEGYLLDMSRYAEENYFEADTEVYEVKSDLSETDSIKEEQMAYISDYVTKCIEALKDGDKETVSNYIDLDSLVDIYIANEIAKNVDVGWDSFYLSKDAGGKLTFGPVWDFDLALGNTDCVKGFDSYKGFSAYTILNINANSNPWFCYALENQWFRELVQDRWNGLQDKLDTVADMVTEEAEANMDSYLRNFECWDVLGTQVYTEPAYIAAMDTYKEHYTYLSDWVGNRIDWLSDYINTDDFINGIFVNEDGEVLSASSNMIPLSSLMAFAMGGDISYELTDGNTGMVLTINKGGSFSWAIQALATGFMLENGQEYELSFDYSATKDASTSVAIQQNHDSYAQYFSGDLNFTSEVQHFDGTFTATSNDTNTALAISLGGSSFDGSVVTIKNMKLVKKTAAVTEEPAVTDGLTASLSVADDWTTGATCNITITNNTDEDITDGWTLDFDFAREIQNVWCATLVCAEDGHYTISNPSWNKTLKAGESYTFGFTAGEGTDNEMTNVVVK